MKSEHLLQKQREMRNRLERLVQAEKLVKLKNQVEMESRPVPPVESDLIVSTGSTDSDSVPLIEDLVVAVKAESHKLTKHEKCAKEELESEGWTVIRHGWPDFLCYRSDPNTGKLTIHPVEIKGPNKRKLDRASQRLVAVLLSDKGFPVIIYCPGDKSIQYSMLSTADRIKLGIEKARKEGKPIGRKGLDIDRSQVIALRQKGKSLSQLAKHFNISKASICRIIGMARNKGIDV